MYFTESDVVIPTELTLHPQSLNITTIHVPIGIIDDEIPENDEKFRVTINFEGSGQGDLYANIIVIDDDRKLYYMYITIFVCVCYT